MICRDEEELVNWRVRNTGIDAGKMVEIGEIEIEILYCTEHTILIEEKLKVQHLQKSVALVLLIVSVKYPTLIMNILSPLHKTVPFYKFAKFSLPSLCCETHGGEINDILEIYNFV